MAAELYINFENKNWYLNNKETIVQHIVSLETFVYRLDYEFWLRDIHDDTYDYDVRIFLNNNFIMLEIDYHPISIEVSLGTLLKWMRKQTSIIVQDEDGEVSGW